MSRLKTLSLPLIAVAMIALALFAFRDQVIALDDAKAEKDVVSVAESDSEESGSESEHEHGKHSEDGRHVDDDGHSHGAEEGAHGEHDDHADHDPLGATHLFAHVQDQTYFEVPRFMDFEGERDGHINIPQPFRTEQPVIPASGFFKPAHLQISKFMVLQVFAGLLIICAFCWLAGKIRDGSAAKGKLANMLEGFVLFVRDDIAQPAIGSREDTNKFLPFLLTLFAFVLVCNMFGMVPFLGTATGSLAVTAVLALITFAVVVGSGIKRYGVLGYLQHQVPHMDLPLPIAIGLKPMIFVLELFGLFVKHFVLAVRLFANMLAGHLVLAVFIAFIAKTAGTYLFYGVAPVSVGAAVALSCLELLVAFLQAYIFTFLASLFIGASLHPH